MKTFLRRIFAPVVTALALATAPTAHSAPPQSVAITSHADGASLGELSSPTNSVTLTADAAASSGSANINSVDFRINGVSVGTDLSAPYSVIWTPTAPGTYAITALAADSSSTTNNTLLSAPVTVTVSAVRIATITTPTNNATFPQGSATFVRATASKSDGVVKEVEFIVTGPGGSTSLGVVSSAPYTKEVTFSGAVATYTLVARATASDNTTFESPPVSINVVQPVGTGPSVDILAPVSTDVIATSSNVTISASAGDTDGGTIAGVSFFADGEQIGVTDTTAPYSVTWTPTVVKTYVLTAQATDNNSNARLSSPVSVSVRASAPTVSITAPANGAPANVGVPVSVTATATPSAVSSIISVEFFANNVSLGVDSTSPYSVVWTPQGTGAVALTARATDSNGVTAPSAAVNVNVGTTSLPTVTLASPGATISVGATVNLSATATAAAGLTIAGVTFSANGVPIGTDTTPPSPYTIAWSPSTPGLTTLTATAVDSVNGTTVSNSIQVNVVTPTGSLAVALNPSGSISMPAGSTRLITGTPTPSTGVARVELLDDDVVIATDTSAPYTFLYTAPANAFGLRQLKARVVDATGATAVSTATGSLNVTITTPTGSPPLIGISTPTANAFLAPNTATTISGTVADSDGFITGIQVFVNDTLLTGLPTISGGNWSMAWTTPATPGVASITAIATDNSGNSVAAPAVGVNIADTASPGIALSISPAVSGQPAPTTFPSGAVRNFVANVTPSPGRAVVRVEFFVDGTKVGDDTSAPYTFRYAAPVLNEGEQSRSFVFSARATDNAGAARDVQVPLLVVQPVGAPPVVNLITPTNDATALPNTDVNIAATAVSAGGSIVSVQFYVNGDPTPVNNGVADTAAPFNSIFRPTTAGSFTIDAIATDDRGNTAVSNSATISAAFATPTIVFTSPNPNATARATPNVPVTLAATATVQGGGAAIQLVEFLLDGVQIGADTTATANGSYSISWLPTTAQLGQHVLTARVTDSNSQTVTSAPLNVNVANVVGSPPTVTVQTPPAPVGGFGLQTASTINFVANAVATGGSTLRSVELFLNDISIGTGAREQTTNLYRVAYDLNRFDFTAITPDINPNTGALTYPVRLYAIARDSNDNQTVSSTVNLTINPATSSPPTVQLQALSPTNITAGTQFFIAPNINDPDGVVASLQLFANGTAVGTFANPQQGQPIFYAANQAGRYNIYAVVTDDTGNTAVSSPSIVVNVSAVSAPTTTITRPSDNTTATTVGAPVFLEGTAVNNVTTQVPTLQFVATAAGGGRTLITGQRVGTTTSYRATWVPVNPDVYTLTTQASVGTVQGTSSVSRRVRVTNVVDLAPTVTITGGVPTSATTASQRNFTATAADPDGSVVEVEFFLNRNSLGQAVHDPQGNTWRLTASFAGLQPGATEVVALARDSSGNVVDSTTNNINVTAATSIAPSITITPSTLNPAFNRQVQLRANARDTDGNVTSVQYFANATSIGTSTNSGSSFLTNWTPTASGTYYVWAMATDNSNNTTISPTIEVVVRRNNPVLENAAFILQTYQDIANTTNINPLVFDDLDERLGAGTLSRAELVASLLDQPGFDAPVNLLAAYYTLMGVWPTPQNYTTLLATARTNFPNAIGGILNSNEYFAKYGATPTVALLNNPLSAIPADIFINRIWQGSGLGTPSPVDNVAFRSNPTALPTLGRGYGPAGLNSAVAEFITNTNSRNTALFDRARAAALFYQLARPPVTVTVDEITQRVNALLPLADAKARADAVLKDILYGYRYVTITKHPTSLTLAPRSGALFSVEAQGAPPLAYQWLLNGAPIPGANAPLLSLTNVDTTRVGSYTAVITSAAGVATSDPAILTLSSTPTRLANISTRGVTAGGANVLIGGFVVTGANVNQTRQMLIRVVGPRLASAPFNVTGVLDDPRLELYSSRDPSTPVLTNDNWRTQAGGNAQVTAITQATNRAGAFALGNNSLDAAVLATLPPGLYTVQAKGPANAPNASGVVLIEIYDVTTGNAVGPKAINVSTRGQVGTGSNVVIAGFVVNGAVSRRMLIRGAGPTLSSLGVPGVLADPQITLVAQSSGQTIRTNDNWASGEDAAVIASAASTAGAFPFANGSRDAAMIVMLAPGAYTVQLSGVGNTTGVGIVEVYDVDP